MSVLGTVHAVAYVAGAIAAVAGAALAWTPAWRRHTGAVLVAALGLLSVSAVARWALTGHPPIFGTFENSIASTWFVLAAVLALGWVRRRDPLAAPEGLARGLILWVVPLLAIGLFFDRTPYPLTISERSLVVDVHVLFAWGAHTVLLAALTAAIAVLAGRTGDDPAPWDQVMFRGAGVGFALFTAMIAFGSLYSFLLFSDWFRWEIVETFAAAAWVAYGATLHAAMMFGWRGRRLASALLLASVLMLCTFWVWSFWSGTYHHFEIPAIRAE